MRLITRSSRWRPAAGTLTLVALLATALASPTSAQDALAPVCTAATAGQLSAQAGVRCGCRHFPASALAAIPAGYRWDCGILRARRNDAPVDLNLYPYPLPEALSIERGAFEPIGPRPER
jgi:hypothetical protein